MMRKHKMNYRKLAAAVLAGAMLSLAAAGSAFAATGGGPATAAATRAWQKSRKDLAQDGVVGLKTWTEALNTLE
jgi:hypothetical protein